MTEPSAATQTLLCCRWAGEMALCWTRIGNKCMNVIWTCHQSHRRDLTQWRQHSSRTAARRGTRRGARPRQLLPSLQGAHCWKFPARQPQQPTQHYLIALSNLNILIKYFVPYLVALISKLVTKLNSARNAKYAPRATLRARSHNYNCVPLMLMSETTSCECL